MNKGTILFIGFWILLVTFLAWGNDNDADITASVKDEPCRTIGHPLWTDC